MTAGRCGSTVLCCLISCQSYRLSPKESQRLFPLDEVCLGCMLTVCVTAAPREGGSFHRSAVSCPSARTVSSEPFWLSATMGHKNGSCS